MIDVIFLRIETVLIIDHNTQIYIHILRDCCIIFSHFLNVETK